MRLLPILLIFFILTASAVAYVSQYSLTVKPGNSIDKRDCNHYSNVYDNTDLATHASKACCWIVVYSNVYDVSNISGGFTCGDDNTREYYTAHGVDTRPLHGYLIGKSAGTNTGTVTLNIKGQTLQSYTAEQALMLQNNAYVLKVLKWMFKA